MRKSTPRGLDSADSSGSTGLVTAPRDSMVASMALVSLFSKSALRPSPAIRGWPASGLEAYEQRKNGNAQRSNNSLSRIIRGSNSAVGGGRYHRAWKNATIMKVLMRSAQRIKPRASIDCQAQIPQLAHAARRK